MKVKIKQTDVQERYTSEKVEVLKSLIRKGRELESQEKDELPIIEKLKLENQTTFTQRAADNQNAIYNKINELIDAYSLIREVIRRINNK